VAADDLRGGRRHRGGIWPFGYLTSMVVTIALCLALAPAIGAIARAGKAKKC
jgi:hypothetical protein